MCAEQSYQSPEVESTRVSASSYCSSSASWLVKKSVSAICGVVAEVRPAGGHEVQRLVEPRGEVLVLLRRRRAAHEVEVPAIDLVQVGVAALGEGAQQVERRGRLVVGLHHALRIGMRASGVNSKPLTLSPR
jgi:hypothetical protein